MSCGFQGDFPVVLFAEDSQPGADSLLSLYKAASAAT
jgi:hypothetical protein